MSHQVCAAAAAAAVVLFATAARADQLDVNNQADSEVIASVALADKLKGLCMQSGGMTPALASAVSSWERANSIDRVRAELTRMTSDPASRGAMHALDRHLDSVIAPVRGQSCSGLQRLVANPSAAFAARAARLTPGLQTAQRGSSPVVTSAAPPTSRATAPQTATSNGAVRGIAQQIEGFAFDTRAGMGLGGMVSLVVYPVVLFRNGQALTDVEGLGFAGGVDAHRRANPGDWTQWRRAGGKVQTVERGAWTDLPFTAVYQRVPAGFSLTGRYQRTGGVGNIAMGGTDAVTTWETYDFFPGGRVIKGGGAGSQATGGDFSVVSRSVLPNQRGRYAIDGLTLVLTYDDGSTESAIFVTDPQDPSVVWLNGRDFRRIRPR